MNVPLALPKTYYLAQAYALAMKSRDPNTQIGSVIVNSKGKIVGEGWNDLIPGVVETPEKCSRPLKYHWFEHAERNSIFDARKRGFDNLTGCVMFCPYFCCSDCCREIIRSKISHIVGHKTALDATSDRWKDSILASYEMLKELGITYEHIDCNLHSLYPEMNLKIRFNDEDLVP